MGNYREIHIKYQQERQEKISELMKIMIIILIIIIILIKIVKLIIITMHIHNKLWKRWKPPVINNSKCDQIRRKLRIWSHLLKKFTFTAEKRNSLLCFLEFFIICQIFFFQFFKVIFHFL